MICLASPDTVARGGRNSRILRAAVDDNDYEARRLRADLPIAHLRIWCLVAITAIGTNALFLSVSLPGFLFGVVCKKGWYDVGVSRQV